MIAGRVKGTFGRATPPLTAGQGIPHPKTWPPVEKQPARDADLLSNEEADEAKKAGASVQRAIAYAFSAHAGQVRKGTSIPYVSHLLAVAAIVFEYGGDEDLACAALLHDVIEDCGAEHDSAIQEL